MKILAAMLPFLASAAWAQSTLPPKIAALISLAPERSYIHLFCDKDEGGTACAVTFRCAQYVEPVTWTVDVRPSRIFTYWPGKTDRIGNPAGLEAALMDAGLIADDARKRTSCMVHSHDPVEVRGYTYLAGHLISVTNQASRASAIAAPPDEPPSITEPTPEPPPTPATPPPPAQARLMDGYYTVFTRVAQDPNFYCGGAGHTESGTVNVSNGAISGAAEGTRVHGAVSSSGSVSGYYTDDYSGQRIGAFTGQVDSTRSASGTWRNTDVGCSGTWSLSAS